MIDITVILPTYKPSDYLYECLDSLRRQNIYPQTFEVLIILNGPLDGFFQDIESYLSQNECHNFRLITSNNPGVSLARNIGLDQAKGDYIFFMDDDDILSDTYLIKLLNYSAPKRMTCSNMRDFSSDIAKNIDSYMSKLFNKEKKVISTDKLKYRRLFSTSTAKLIPSSVIQDKRFNTTFKLGEDALFMFSISCNLEEISLVSNSIYYRRVRLGSATSSTNGILFELQNAIRLIISYTKTYISNPKVYNFSFFIMRMLAVLKGLYNRLFK